MFLQNVSGRLYLMFWKNILETEVKWNVEWKFWVKLKALEFSAFEFLALILI